MTITQDPTHTCRVPASGDGDERVFRGVLLGEASTHRKSGGLRWFEIKLFRNDDQPNAPYVVSKIGRTVVYHRPGCESLRLPEDVEPEVLREPPDDWKGCPTCEPDLDNGPVILERDRITLRDGLLAFEVLEALRQRNDDTGEWFLSATARHALRSAIEKDDDLMRAYARDTLSRHH